MLVGCLTIFFNKLIDKKKFKNKILPHDDVYYLIGQMPNLQYDLFENKVFTINTIMYEDLWDSSSWRFFSLVFYLISPILMTFYRFSKTNSNLNNKYVIICSDFSKIIWRYKSCDYHRINAAFDIFYPFLWIAMLAIWLFSGKTRRKWRKFQKMKSCLMNFF